jgi:hypothetical protein
MNRVARERWSRVETVLDDETREYNDVCHEETKPEGNGTGEEALATEDGMLPQPSSSALSMTRGCPACEIGFGDVSIS